MHILYKINGEEKEYTIEKKNNILFSGEEHYHMNLSHGLCETMWNIFKSLQWQPLLLSFCSLVVLCRGLFVKHEVADYFLTQSHL